MAETVYTQDLLNKVKLAFASGTTSLEYDGKRIQYRSLAEMQTIISTMQREIDEAANGKPSSRQIRMKTGRGLDGHGLPWSRFWR